jgi:hypothetical protein
MGCLFNGKGPQRTCAEDYPTDYRYWCTDCLRSQLQADERAYRLEIARLRRRIRRLLRAARRPRKGVA